MRPPHWWQRNSNFQKWLSLWLDLTDVRIEPFHWGHGPNSELARRAAGQELFKRLRQFEEFGENYLLIGHSHGGSVIYHALIEAAGKQHELPHLKQWITIGSKGSALSFDVSMTLEKPHTYSC